MIKIDNNLALYWYLSQALTGGRWKMDLDMFDTEAEKISLSENCLSAEPSWRWSKMNFRCFVSPGLWDFHLHSARDCDCSDSAANYMQDDA